MAPGPGGGAKIAGKKDAESEGDVERAPVDDDGDVAITNADDGHNVREQPEDLDADAEGEEVYDEDDTIVAAKAPTDEGEHNESSPVDDGDNAPGNTNGKVKRKPASSSSKLSESEESSGPESSSLISDGEDEWDKLSETAREVAVEVADSNHCMYAISVNSVT